MKMLQTALPTHWALKVILLLYIFSRLLGTAAASHPNICIN